MNIGISKSTESERKIVRERPHIESAEREQWGQGSPFEGKGIPQFGQLVRGLSPELGAGLVVASSDIFRMNIVMQFAGYNGDRCCSVTTISVRVRAEINAEIERAAEETHTKNIELVT